MPSACPNSCAITVFRSMLTGEPVVQLHPGSISASNSTAKPDEVYHVHVTARITPDCAFHPTVLSASRPALFVHAPVPAEVVPPPVKLKFDRASFQTAAAPWTAGW